LVQLLVDLHVLGLSLCFCGFHVKQLSVSLTSRNSCQVIAVIFPVNLRNNLFWSNFSDVVVHFLVIRTLLVCSGTF